MSNPYERQKDIITPEELKRTINIVGLGGIGSWTSLYLAKMGCQHLVLIDPDTVEEHNLASQFYQLDDVDCKKVMSTLNNIRSFNPSNCSLTCYEELIETKVPCDILIIAVDSMERRIEIAQQLEYEPQLIIDGRMGGDIIEVFTCDTLKKYKESLVAPEYVDKDPCTGRAVVYNTAIIGGIICNQVKRFCKGQPYKQEIVIDLGNMVMGTEKKERSS